MNTVMDDNMTLTLASYERIPLTPPMCLKILKVYNRPQPLMLVLYTSLLLLPSVCSLDFLTLQSEMKAVTEEDRSPNLVGNLHEYVGVFTQIAVFVVKLFCMYRRGHLSRMKERSSLTHLRRILHMERQAPYSTHRGSSILHTNEGVKH